MHHDDCASAEPAAGESGAKRAGGAGRLNHDIQFRAGVFKVFDRALMRLEKQLSECRKISATDQFNAALYPVDFADDMRRSFGCARIDPAPAGFKFCRRYVPQGGNRMRQQLRQLRGGLFAAFASFIIGGIGEAVFDVRVHDEKLNIIRQFDR